MPQGTAARLVLRQDKDGIAYVTMNRPNAYNALSTHHMSALQVVFDAIANNRSIKVVVLAGAGKGFCAGHDLKEIRQHQSEFHARLFAQCSHLMLSIVRLPQPVIACVHGMAAAAGCQLVASCDLAVAEDTALFSTPGVNIGLFCSTPMVAVSRQMPRKHVMGMLLTGERITAAKAVQSGLINEAVPSARLRDRVDEFANLIASKAPKVLAIGKEAFYRQLELPLAEAYNYTSDVMTENMQLADAIEGISAFIEKRQPVWAES